MRTVLIASVAASALFGETAHAYFIDGNKLYQDCTNPGTYTYYRDEAACIGYIAGATDMMVRKCDLPNVKLGQMRDVVVNYLRTYPQFRHYSADLITLWAIDNAFPCR